MCRKEAALLLENARLKRQIDFVREVDRLKNVFRQTLLMDGTRYENDAEHSWHVCLMAMLLHEYADSADLDVLRVIKMLLVHDIVEIEAGDTYCYDEEAHRDKAAREQAAADRLFGLLPEEQGADVRALWEEFEAMQTPESRFAAALDRLQPLLHNYYTKGEAWRRHGVRRSQVLKRNSHIRDGAPELWAFAEDLIAESVRRGYLEDG